MALTVTELPAGVSSSQNDVAVASVGSKAKCSTPVPEPPDAVSVTLAKPWVN